MAAMKQDYEVTERVPLSFEVTLEVSDRVDGFEFRLVNTETGRTGDWGRHGKPAFLPNPAQMYPSGYYVYWMSGQAPMGLDDEHLYYIYKVNT